MLTEEQSQIIEIAKSNKSTNTIITVNAVAGSGKTTTATEIVKALRPTKGIYTAFNRSIVHESGAKMLGLIDAKTMHSLAVKFYPHRNLNNVKNMTYSDIKEFLSYADKQLLIDNINNYFLSKYTKIDDFFNCPYCTIFTERLRLIMVKYVSNLLKGKSSYTTYNAILKIFHFLLVTKTIKPTFDLIILDECQDTTAVSLEIFKLLNSPKKIILGDKHQNIYSFMNTINGFNELDEETIPLHLTKSFRCSEAIGKKIEEYGQEYFHSNFKFRGSKHVSNIPAKEGKVYLSVNNQSALLSMANLIEKGVNFSLTRDIDSIAEFPMIMNDIVCYRPVSTEYKYLVDEYAMWTRDFASQESAQQYFRNKGLNDASSAIVLLTHLQSKGINLSTLIKEIKSRPKDKNTIVSTVHSFKGLEQSTAIINKDLKHLIFDASASYKNLLKDKETMPYSLYKEKLKHCEQDLNLYYVALSRAKNQLILNS